MELDPKVYFETPKPLAILTNTLNTNLMEVGNKVYADHKYRKHLLTKTSSYDRFIEHSPGAGDHFSRFNATLDSVEGLNLRKAIEHL